MEQNCDMEQICKALEATISTDMQMRQQAEQFMFELGSKSGVIPMLLQLTCNDQISELARLSAAVLMKNGIRNRWKTDEEAQTQNLLNEEDKTFIKNNFFESMVKIRNDKRILPTFEECLRLIVLFDYPNQWNDLLDVVCANLEQRSDIVRVHCALLALHKMSMKYEMIIGNDRSKLDEIIDKTFPLMLRLAADLVQSGYTQSNEDTSIILKLVLKCYWCSTQIALDKSGTVTESLDHWMELMERLITEPVPESVTADCDREDLAKLPIFKVKKWALQIVHRFFSRYNPRCVGGTNTSAVDIEFSTKFMSKWANNFMNKFISLLLSASSNAQPRFHMTQVMESLLIQYLTQCLQLSATYTQLKPQLSTIVNELCFPLLKYNEDDVSLFDDDAEEFMLRQLDLGRGFSNARASACEFIQSAGRYRTRDVLPIITNQAEKIVKEYEIGTPEQKQQLSQQKYASLIMVGCISERLTSKRRQLEMRPFLLNHVIPEFQNPTNKMLRCISCWTFEKFLKNIKVTNESFDDIVGIYMLMLERVKHDELPVRVQAGSCIKYFLKSKDEKLRQKIIETIPDLMSSLLDSLKDVDCDCVVSTLQELVAHFESEIPPFAQRLINCLSQLFLKMVGDGSKDNEERWVNVMLLLDTVISVLSCLRDKPNMYSELDLSTMLSHLFSPNMSELLEEALKILSFFIKYPITMNPNLWVYYEQIYVAVCGCGNVPASECVDIPVESRDGWAWEQFEDVVPIVENFIWRDPQTLLNGIGKTGKTYKMMLLEMASKAITRDGETALGLSLLVRLFDYFSIKTGSIDDLLQPAFEIQYNCLKENTDGDEDTLDKASRVNLLRLWALTLYYNPITFFQLLENRTPKITNEVFTYWLKHVDDMTTLTSKKSLVMGFTKLMTLYFSNPAIIPEFVTKEMPQIMKQVTSNSFDIIQLREAGSEAEGSDADSDESSDSEQDLQDNQDASPRKSLLMKLTDGDLDDEDDDEDESYTGEVEEDKNDIKSRSALDSLNELYILSETLKQFNSDQANVLTSWLGSEDLEKLKKAIASEADVAVHAKV